MHILLIEPFYAGSHKAWVDGFREHTSHKTTLLSLPGRHWKWRMYGAAVTLAEQFNQLEELPDKILVSDMLDLSTFVALTRKRLAGIEIILYFHENQIAYPWSPSEEKTKAFAEDVNFGFLNYTSSLVADRVLFNSEYNKESFLEGVQTLMNRFPDHRHSLHELKNKCSVLHLGINLKKFDQYSQVEENDDPVILWNHRWEYDKNPEAFFEALYELKADGYSFKLIVLGAQYDKNPEVFGEAYDKLKEEIIDWGYKTNFEDYARCLWKADILPVTSNQDFFGISIAEAIYCKTIPLLPQRVAYPEVFPEARFYTGNILDDLKELVFQFQDKNRINESVHLYKWENMIDEYDAIFE